MTRNPSLFYFGVFFLTIALLPVIVAAGGLYFVGVAAKQSLLGEQNDEYESNPLYS